MLLLLEILKLQIGCSDVVVNPPFLFPRLSLARRLSKEVFRSKSSSNLSIRRLSSDINMAAGRFLDCHASQAIGRRLSRDTNLSPPDINSRRASHLSIGRKPSSQLLGPSDVDSSSDVSAPPRSPNLLDTGFKSPNLLLPTNSVSVQFWKMFIKCKCRTQIMFVGLYR